MGVVEQWEGQGTYHDIGGERVFVVDRAAEHDELEPVLILHGFPTCSYDWRSAIDVLATRRRVIAPDYPGFGLSDKPDRKYSLFEQADVVGAVIEGLGLREVALATPRPGRLDRGRGAGPQPRRRRVVRDHPAGDHQRIDLHGPRAVVRRPAAAAGAARRGATARVRGPTRARSRARSEARWRRTRRSTRPSSTLLGALVAHGGGNRVLPRTIRYIEERRVHEGRWTGAIERHESPLTIIWGDVDPIAVWPMAERLHERRPDATLVRLDGIGHYPMLEAPDAFNAALEHAARANGSRRSSRRRRGRARSWSSSA